MISQVVCDSSRKGVICHSFLACRLRCSSIGWNTPSTWAMTYSEIATPWALLLQMRVPLAASFL
jgi:hypothetical protein